jgi:hypothetical protein
VSARVVLTSRRPAALPAPSGAARSLMAGATGRVWAAPGHLRAVLRVRDGERVELLATDRDFWVYESGSNRLVRGKLPAGTTDRSAQPGPAAVKRLMMLVQRHATLSRAVPGVVAGRPAYTVTAVPRGAAGLGRAELSWDARHALPLRAALYLGDAGDPVLELRATDVSLEAVPASVWAAEPPAGARVETLGSRP